ncbi:hypothetical protein L202_05817 [Cryptococcus amylolentus CBS 6039]|uniref:Uncharacterized protein n=2 Tax=Cryptococcus amylolentus TaxID=104669 RepID=A0A1E3HJB5_9TREE|nr:hypothetical protein L202_05817 [Cryptococcus amylolentus CBS 6039]ODN75816.1 hypothetical protein L202_05817 [Cryptococcus amylolentus CBS 6039]ODN96978.1 hypothetical protein I350_07955 [Cryptococcus amylolentus CBS 6273]
MSQSTAPSRRAISHGGSSRLSLSVDKATNAVPAPVAGRHPLRQDWSLSYVHRPPNAKVDYEKEIRRVATFGSIESFLHLYSHLTPVNELPPVTDMLVFVSRIARPGIWEEMRDGGRFTIRLVHPITPVLYESLLFSLIGDQFDESDHVVGCVLSVRQAEGILSVWVEDESDAVRSGALKAKILSLLNLPSTTVCDYRANRALLENATKSQTTTNSSSNINGTLPLPNNPLQNGTGTTPGVGMHAGVGEGGNVEYQPRSYGHHHHERGHRERGERGERGDRGERGERGERGDRRERGDGSGSWSNAFRDQRRTGGPGAGAGAGGLGMGSGAAW